MIKPSEVHVSAEYLCSLYKKDLDETFTNEYFNFIFILSSKH